MDTISIRVGFIEIHKEEILRFTSSSACEKMVQTMITLREDADGAICLNGGEAKLR